MKFVNIINDDKFTADYIDFVEDNLDMSEQVFFVFKTHDKFPIKERSNIFSYDKKKHNYFDYLVFLKNLIKHSIKAEKIIIHGLFKIKITQILWVLRFLLPKCYWAVWGGDLYSRDENLLTRRGRYKEFFRRKVIKDMGYIITSIRGDYENVVKWYGTKASHLPYFMYPASLYHDIPIADKKDNKLNVLIGNSADPTNNHEEAFAKIAPFVNENVRIICPLNYGSKKHASAMVELGNKMFGSSFEPILDYIKYDEYMLLLTTVDIAVFNHNRQQAMSTTRVLLGMGKTVYLRKETSSYEALRNVGAIVHDINEFNLEVSVSDGEKNARAIQQYYSKESLIKNLQAIY
ncbi:TDP-N-acetylfucosamine:lipid II N-acetylfucosaminyltransferase [Vibrio hyugaensis]|uniref:TDP-N-acetylfucosamine:lipid II N-acetylfucosaminyltransferase n=1 Tax=Vibrio hyugaensis TaxID=1534743 RepID=UPI000CE4BA1C|nr:TDP-N-acetylfucosamine:lipid II N-acetylfucosaminyltransferase [Vibrio hyugaensis]